MWRITMRGAAFAVFTMISGFDVNIILVARDGTIVEVDSGG